MRPTGSDPYQALIAASITTSAGCWEVQGYRNSHGYSRIRVEGALVYGHRLSWERSVGRIPEGLVIDHLCRNRACINTEHLQVTTQSANARRNLQAAKTECVHGHTYTPENTGRHHRGWRYCKTCQQLRNKGVNAQQMPHYPIASL